jgi:hypothetical protein
MKDLHSPHNDEKCVCSSDEALTNYVQRDTAEMYKDFASDIDAATTSLRETIKAALEMTAMYKTKECQSAVNEIMQRWILDLEASAQEMMSDIEDVVIEDAQRKCPYCL